MAQFGFFFVFKFLLFLPLKLKLPKIGLKVIVFEKYLNGGLIYLTPLSTFTFSYLYTFLIIVIINLRDDYDEFLLQNKGSLFAPPAMVVGALALWETDPRKNKTNFIEKFCTFFGFMKYLLF